MSENPFQGLRPPEIYDLLIDKNNGLPTWPDEKFQRGYVSSQGQGAVRKTQYFIDMLDKEGAFVPGWRGLDYGAGWGRIASLMLAKGGPEQLDLVDGLDKAMRLLEAGGFGNRRWKVSEILQPGEIPEEEYDFVYAFSVFTHLAPHAFFNNLDFLRKGLKSPGAVYFTVRLPEFVHHKYSDSPESKNEVLAALASEGFWFSPQQNQTGTNPVFGTMVISEGHLRNALGSSDLEYLGQIPGQMQHLYVLRV